MRYTAKTLDNMCDNLNRSLGLPTLDASLEERTTARAFYVEKSYGGYTLVQYANERCGVRTMHDRCATASECANIIRAFESALRYAGKVS
jgi:quinolinate synthase